MFSEVQNIVLSFWKLTAYACQIEILEILACLISTLSIETLLPLDALRWQMASAVMLIY
jgi:hypothetical protein